MYSSFIITYHSRRLENLKQAMRFLEVNHLDVIKESELILVCQDNSPKISTQFGQTHLHNLNVSCMHLPKLTNFGVEQAASKNLVILESDRILPESYFEKALNSLKNGLMITTRIMYKLTEDATDKEILEKNFEYQEEYRTPENNVLTRNMWSGNTICKKSDYIKSGTMDEFYKGYGWADHDMTKTMQKIGVQQIFRDEIELHLHHEPMTYGYGDQKRMFIDNGLYYCKKWNLEVPEELKKEISKYVKII